ncbi:MAG: hypothetical protein E6J90_30630 [Deltaproteobacteria bacterium]|nr:MAG: hypothetical protein E6J90_30630 [Deltaproteobacteria bacterium]
MVRTDETYVVPAPTVLQSPGSTINPCFKTEIPYIPPIQRTDTPFAAPGKLKQVGFTSKPLLHFVWFGTPELSVFGPPFAWAKLLGDSWQGVCVWMDDDWLKQGHGLLSRYGIVQKCYFPISTSGRSLSPCLKIESTEHAPVYFSPIGSHLDQLCTDHPDLEPLRKAIAYERRHDPPWRLAQVASDIMRIIVLRYWAGAYFDFDVRPSEMCKAKGFLDAGLIPFAPDGFVCHRPKQDADLYENDIIFAAQTEKAISRLEYILSAMTQYYQSPSDRHELLVSSLATAFGLENVGTITEHYRQGFRIQGELLDKLSKLVREDLDRRFNRAFREALDDDVLTLTDLLSDNVAAATFDSFQVACQSTGDWNALKPYFDDLTQVKVFYSWKHPGASQCQKLLDEASASQAVFQHRAQPRRRIRHPVVIYQMGHIGSRHVYYELSGGRLDLTTQVIQSDYVLVHVSKAEVRDVAAGCPTKSYRVPSDDVPRLSGYIHRNVLAGLS